MTVFYRKFRAQFYNIIHVEEIVLRVYNYIQKIKAKLLKVRNMGVIEEKLSKIEKEILELKRMIIRDTALKKKVSLKGILKGLQIEEADFIQAKKSLFKFGA